MKKLFFLGGWVLLTVSVFAQDSVLSLRRTVEIAIANNATVKQSEFQMEAAGVNLNQSKGNFIPQLNGTINHNLNSGRSINTANNSYINSSLTTATYNLASSATLFNGFYLLL